MHYIVESSSESWDNIMMTCIKIDIVRSVNSFEFRYIDGAAGYENGTIWLNLLFSTMCALMGGVL